MSIGARILILTALTCPPAQAGHTAPQPGRERRPWGGQSVLACPAWLVGQRAPWGPNGGRGARNGVHAAAEDVASKRLGVCWVGVAKGGRTSLRGGDRERGPCVFLVRRSPVFLGYCLLQAWEGPSQAT